MKKIYLSGEKKTTTTNGCEARSRVWLEWRAGAFFSLPPVRLQMVSAIKHHHKDVLQELFLFEQSEVKNTHACLNVIVLGTDTLGKQLCVMQSMLHPNRQFSAEMSHWPTTSHCQASFLHNWKECSCEDSWEWAYRVSHLTFQKTDYTVWSWLSCKLWRLAPKGSSFTHGHPA